MNIEDEYPSGADEAMRREYERKKRLMTEEQERLGIEKAKVLDSGKKHSKSNELYELTVEQAQSLDEYEKQLEKRARQIFLPQSIENEFSEKTLFCVKRQPRKESYKYDDAVLDFLGDHPLWETRVVSFVNNNDAVERQYFPFSYPDDYLGNRIDYLHCKVSTSQTTMDECSMLYYNPFDIYAQNSNLDIEYEDNIGFEGIEGSVDFRQVNVEAVIRESIHEALNEMCVESADYIDVIMDIPVQLDEYALSYISEVKSYFGRNYPKIQIRVSVNEFNPSSDLQMYNLGWRYLLFEKM